MSTTTYQTIVDAGVATSFENRPNTIATAPTELVRVVYRGLCDAYQLAARENPGRFQTAAVVVKDAAGWARPARAQSIVRIERSDQTEVVVIDPAERAMESRPALIERGPYFYSAGNAQDPTTEDLTFWFAPVPAAPTGLSDTLPPEWPDEFNGLLEFALAAYLARKDGRLDDAQAFAGERDLQSALFLNHLQLTTVATVRQTRIPRMAVPTQTATPRGR